MSNLSYLALKVDFYPKNLKQYMEEARLSRSASELEVERRVILYKLAQGVSYLHRHSIYHRNISPSNVLLDDRLTLAIANFSSIYSPSMRTPPHYQCDWLIRPPEVLLRPDLPSLQGSDVWAIGCVGVYMLTGRMPFEEESDASLLIEMVRVMGRPSQEELSSMSFRDKGNGKFVFPLLKRESMRRVMIVLDRNSTAATTPSSTSCRLSSSTTLPKDPLPTPSSPITTSTLFLPTPSAKHTNPPMI